MRMSFVRATAYTFLLFSAGCSSPVTPDVDDSRALWEASEPVHYAFTLKRDCFCDIRGVRVEIENGVIVAATLVAGDPDLGPIPTPLTIDQIFDLIADRSEPKPDRFELTFDRQRGYPTDVVWDFENTSDAFFHLKVREFTELF